MTGEREEGKSFAAIDRLDIALEQWEREGLSVDPRLLQLISAISMIAQQIEIDFRGLAQQIGYDLGVGDLRILFVLRRSGPTYSLRAVDLGHYLLITSGAITKQVARLERKGFIIRARSAARRGWTIGLTDKGRKVADQAVGMSVMPTTAAAFRSFDAEEQMIGLRFLRRLLGRMEKTRSRESENRTDVVAA